MKALARRISNLEIRIKPKETKQNLDREIAAMTKIERNALRDFLLFLKDGGQPGDAAFDNLKLAAEEAVYRARERLRFKDK